MAIELQELLQEATEHAADWKYHLCEHANYLFLLVPEALRQNDTMRPRNEFNTVSKRLASFFVVAKVHSPPPWINHRLAAA